MKVFWSWQCDTPGSIGRHLIREALAEAITGAAGGGTLYEASREEGRSDAAGPSGIGPPELGRRIFRQIRECDIFVADLTVPGAGEGSPGKEEACNPDVAIELGYFRVVNGGADLIIVVNTAFTRRDLSFRPFGGSPWLATYDLPEGSARPEIGQARKALVEKIGGALRACGGPPAMPSQAWVGADGAGSTFH